MPTSSSGAFQVEVLDYDFGRFVTPPAEGVLFPLEIALRGLVARPTGTAIPSNSPLIILAHGRHSAAVENFRGLEYLAAHLASHGYVCASIDLNDTVAPAGNRLSTRPPLITGAAIFHRAQTILNTITALRDDADFAPRIDFGRVGLIGHSRGGEAVCRAAQMDAEAGEIQGIRAVFSIAPVDFTGTNVPRPLFLLYGDLDGDVSDGQSLRIGDRASGTRYGLYVRNATHNLFSSNWDDERSDLPLGTTLSRQNHENLARAYTLAFFERHLRGQAAHDALLVLAVDTSVPAGVTAERLYPAPHASRIDGFEGAFDPATNSFGLPNTTTGQAEFREIDTGQFTIDPGQYRDRMVELIQLHTALSDATSAAERNELRSRLTVLAQDIVAQLRFAFEATSPNRRTALDEAIRQILPNFAPTGPGWGALSPHLAETNPDPSDMQLLFEETVGVATSDHTLNHVGKALSLQWSDKDAIYASELGGFDASGYAWLHLRVAQDYRDEDNAKRNTIGVEQSITVELRDTAGTSRPVSIDAVDGPILPPSPDQTTFKTALRTVLIPLSEFSDGPGGVNLTSLQEFRVICDRSPSGSIVIDTIGFSRLGGPGIA